MATRRHRHRAIKNRIDLPNKNIFELKDKKS